jgi:hypothetical protein
VHGLGCSTSVHLVMGSEQQGSRNCWGVDSLDIAGSKILVQLCAASAETMAG